jgi:hypothetical protein
MQRNRARPSRRITRCLPKGSAPCWARALASSVPPLRLVRRRSSLRQTHCRSRNCAGSPSAAAVRCCSRLLVAWACIAGSSSRYVNVFGSGSTTPTRSAEHRPSFRPRATSTSSAPIRKISSAYSATSAPIGVRTHLRPQRSNSSHPRNPSRTPPCRLSEH